MVEAVVKYWTLQDHYSLYMNLAGFGAYLICLFYATSSMFCFVWTRESIFSMLQYKTLYNILQSQLRKPKMSHPFSSRPVGEEQLNHPYHPFFPDCFFSFFHTIIFFISEQYVCKHNRIISNDELSDRNFGYVT